MKSAFWRATALLIAIGLMMPAAAMAEGMAGEVAHSSMGGSTLMPTSAQLNTWTHWATKYGNFTEVDTGDLSSFGSSEDGQATLIWDYDGDNTLLFRVRQYDLGSQNSNFMWGGTLDSPFLQASDFAGSQSSNNAFDMGQMLNVALARELSGGGAFSVGILFAAHGDEQKLVGDGATDESTAFGGQVTWGNGNGLDLAVSFVSESSSNNDGTAGASDLEGDFTLFDGYLRYEHNDWIYQGGAAFGSGKDDQDDLSAIGMLGNVGRFLKNDSDGTVTVEFYANYFQTKFEPDGGGEEKSTDTILPGMRSACTQMVTDSFGLMLGANAYYNFSGFTQNDGTDDITDNTSKGMDFMWDAGIFYENGNLRLEAQLDQGNLGKIASLGNDDNLVVRLGGTYNFN